MDLSSFTRWEDITALLLAQKSCSIFLQTLFVNDITDETISKSLTPEDVKSISFQDEYKKPEKSWDELVQRVQFQAENYIISDESNTTKKILDDIGVVWCYNKSCTGKTYLAINTLL